ncbi:hypothetical protein M5K25_001841 [Dendrobium thyrsiflorum]|uniref:Uncharacterized protein n=1 Tax=Dendrobium thyrsiflorum TaxID=117978 RepID=A0ABD0VRV9_DENTH
MAGTAGAGIGRSGNEERDAVMSTSESEYCYLTLRDAKKSLNMRINLMAKVSKIGTVLKSRGSGPPPYIEAMSGDHLPSRDNAAQNGGERRPNKGARLDDAASTATSDSLIVLHKKFYFSNDLVATVPKKFDRACLPPPGYIAIYETSLRAGLRFLPLELIDIVPKCGVSLAQFSYRATSVTIGLIALFSDRGRYEARILKISSKVPELHVPVSKVAPKRQARGDDLESLKKKKLEGIVTNTNKAPLALPPPGCVF